MNRKSAVLLFALFAATLPLTSFMGVSVSAPISVGTDITCTAVSELFSLSPRDGQTVDTTGYSTAGVGGGTYRYSLGSSATIDGGFVLPGVGGTLSFSGVTFNGTAGTGRWLAVNAATIDVTQCGVTTSGDQLNALQRAINTCAGKTLTIAPGTYTFSATLDLPSNVSIKGAGPTQSILLYSGTGIAFERVSGVTTGVSMRDLCIKGTDTNGGTGLKLDSFSRCQFVNVLIDMFRNAGDTGTGLLMHCTDGVCAFNYFENLEISNCDDALVMDSTADAHSTGYNTFNRLVIGTEVRGLRLLKTEDNGSVYNSFTGLFFQNSATTTHCLEIAGQANVFNDITIDIQPDDYELDIAATGNGNFFRFLTALTITPTVSVSGLASNIFTSVGHGYTNGTKIQFTTDMTLPTGLTALTDYYVINKADDTFQVSATYGGGAVSASGGSGTLVANGIPKYRNQQSGGAPNVVLTQTQALGAPGEPVIIQDDLQNLEVDYRSGGVNKEVEIFLGNSSNTRQWKMLSSASSSPYFALQNSANAIVLSAEQAGNMGFFGGVDNGGGVGVVFINNATTVPTTNPTGGGLFYSEGGALKWRNPSGTVTTIAP